MHLIITIIFQLVSALTSIKPVNQTDAMTILSSFGNLESIINASESKLCDCVGFGTRKAKKLYKTLHEPFLKQNKNTQKKLKQTDLKRSYTNVLNDKGIEKELMKAAESVESE